MSIGKSWAAGDAKRCTCSDVINFKNDSVFLLEMCIQISNMICMNCLHKCDWLGKWKKAIYDKELNSNNLILKNIIDLKKMLSCYRRFNLSQTCCKHLLLRTFISWLARTFGELSHDYFLVITASTIKIIQCPETWMFAALYQFKLGERFVV